MDRRDKLACCFALACLLYGVVGCSTSGAGLPQPDALGPPRLGPGAREVGAADDASPAEWPDSAAAPTDTTGEAGIPCAPAGTCVYQKHVGATMPDVCYSNGFYQQGGPTPADSSGNSQGILTSAMNGTVCSTNLYPTPADVPDYWAGCAPGSCSP